MTIIEQRTHRGSINFMFVYKNTGLFTEDGLPIYRVCLIDTNDHSMLITRFILLTIFRHSFRIISITTNEGVIFKAIETNLEIAGEPNSRFSDSPL